MYRRSPKQRKVSLASIAVRRHLQTEIRTSPLHSAAEHPTGQPRAHANPPGDPPCLTGAPTRANA